MPSLEGAGTTLYCVPAPPFSLSTDHRSEMLVFYDPQCEIGKGGPELPAPLSPTWLEVIGGTTRRPVPLDDSDLDAMPYVWHAVEVFPAVGTVIGDIFKAIVRSTPIVFETNGDASRTARAMDYAIDLEVESRRHFYLGPGFF